MTNTRIAYILDYNSISKRINSDLLTIPQSQVRFFQITDYINDKYLYWLLKTDFYGILQRLSSECIEVMSGRHVFETQLTHENIKNIYFNILKKAKQCYKDNIITKGDYVYLLKNLLYIIY